MKEIIEPTYDEENKISDIVVNLYDWVKKETEKRLKNLLELLGYEFAEKKGSEIYNWDAIKDLQKIDYPDDPYKLGSYFYKGHEILSLRISETPIRGIEFISADPRRIEQILLIEAQK